MNSANGGILQNSAPLSGKVELEMFELKNKRTKENFGSRATENSENNIPHLRANVTTMSDNNPSHSSDLQTS